MLLDVRLSIFVEDYHLKKTPETRRHSLFRLVQARQRRREATRNSQYQLFPDIYSNRHKCSISVTCLLFDKGV